MDTTGEYISGEEMLSGWAPRGVSLLRDFIQHKNKQRRIREIEAARGILSLNALSPPIKPTMVNGESDSSIDERQKLLLAKFLDIWRTKTFTAADILLLRSDIDSPPSGLRAIGTTYGDSEPPPPPLLAAVVDHTPKTPALLKGGWLLSPDPSGTRWIRRYVELRRPYLHLYSSEGDEVSAINLTNSRIDAEPEVAKLLQRSNVRLVVWALYTTNKAWLFACRNDKERGEWIWAVDQSLYVASHPSDDYLIDETADIDD
jgi:kinesin family protein 1